MGGGILPGMLTTDFGLAQALDAYTPLGKKARRNFIEASSKLQSMRTGTADSEQHQLLTQFPWKHYVHPVMSSHSD